MSIFGRFITMVKSWLNHLISKAEDPEKMLNQSHLDMQEQLINAKRQVASAIADEKRLEKQYQNELAKMNEWENRAMLAVRSGNDELAQQALDRKAEHEQLAKGYQESWNAQKNATEGLKKAIITLSNKVEEAGRKKNLLIARARRAEAQKSIAGAMSSMTQNGAVQNFERIAEKVERNEAEAAAIGEVDNLGDDLDSKFRQLEGEGIKAANSDALAALKAKMGIPSGVRQLSSDEIHVEVVDHSKTGIKKY